MFQIEQSSLSNTGLSDQTYDSSFSRNYDITQDNPPNSNIHIPEFFGNLLSLGATEKTEQSHFLTSDPKAELIRQREEIRNRLIDVTYEPIGKKDFGLTNEKNGCAGVSACGSSGSGSAGSGVGPPKLPPKGKGGKGKKGKGKNKGKGGKEKEGNNWKGKLGKDTKAIGKEMASNAVTSGVTAGIITLTYDLPRCYRGDLSKTQLAEDVAKNTVKAGAKSAAITAVKSAAKKSVKYLAATEKQAVSKVGEKLTKGIPVIGHAETIYDSCMTVSAYFSNKISGGEMATKLSCNAASAAISYGVPFVLGGPAGIAVSIAADAFLDWLCS